MEKQSILGSAFGKQKRWVKWSYEKDDKGKPTKIPYQLKGGKGVGRASSTDPKTWSTYEEIIKVSEKVGIIFTPDKILLGIDIDHCLKDGKIVHSESTEIERFLAEANTYTEISPSNEGLHVYLVLSGPVDLIKTKSAPYEVYTDKRFFTVTNNPFREVKALRTVTPQDAVALLGIIGYPWQKKENEKVSASATTTADDATVLSRMFSSKKVGAKIQSLYSGDISAYKDDDSSADLALCSYLAFWTSRNYIQIERIWLNSPLGIRNKTQDRKDYRDRTIKTAIDGCKTTYSGSKNHSDLTGTGNDQKDKNNLSQASILTEYVLGLDDVTLFHDEKGDGCIALNINNHQEVRALKSRAIKIWLSSELYRLEKNAPSGTEVIKSVLSVLQGKAYFEGTEIKLHNRVAWHNDELWYDLINDEWQTVKIGKNGWEIINESPILFKRYSHNKSQVLPKRNGNALLLLKYVNIKNSQHRLLYLVFVISCFVPDFPHVMLVIFGAQGASKSTCSKISGLVIDPSLIDTASFPKKEQDLIQALDHHYFIFFDNVSYISEDQSDILCKAITGGGHTTRELYSDDEDIIRNFKRSIGINGINLVTTRPDLLERSLLLELERVSPEERKTEKELYKNFNEDLPSILGGIFDVLAKTLDIYPSIKLNLHHRMADWVMYGCAIAEALGYTKEEFLDAYENNISHQNEMLLSENIVATAVITFMEDKDSWEGTCTELLLALSRHALFVEIDTREKNWPKGANALSRRLNELSTPLKKMGISVVITSGMERSIRIEKENKKKSDDNDGIF